MQSFGGEQPYPEGVGRETGKRRKVHNFPIVENGTESLASPESSEAKTWRRRLSALVAATGQAEPELLDYALSLLAVKVLRRSNGQTEA
jgi:hypothetical protein